MLTFLRVLFSLCFVILIAFIQPAKAQEKLIFALDLIRHGDRTAIYTLPKYPHIWEQGLGQLTPTGMKQEFERGSSRREAYIKEYHLLPPNYHASTIYVRSTNYDRTLMSAESFLLGLYPQGTGPVESLPEAFQPIPIHSQPHVRGDEFDGSMNKKLVNRYVSNRLDWIQKTQELEGKFKHWSQATGVPIKSLYNLIKLSDTLYVYKQHQIEPPKELSSTDVDEIIKEGRWVYATTFKPYEIGQIRGRQILEDISKRLTMATKENSELKFVLFSAHDSNITSVLSALKSPLSEPPPYASDLNFLLFETDSKKYIVKINFNDKPVFIPYCQNTSCTLNQFQQLVKLLKA